MAWTEQNRRTEGGGLEHRVKSSGVKRTANERDVGECVEVAEDADPVNEQNISGWRIGRIDAGEPKVMPASPDDD